MNKKMTAILLIVAASLAVYSQAQAEDSIHHIRNEYSKEIYESSSRTLSGVNGAAPGSQYPAGGAILQSVKDSPNFKDAQSWLYGEMKENQYGQVRIVLTPKSLTCKKTRNHESDIDGIQCVSESSVTLYFAPQTDINKYGKFTSFGRPLIVKAVGANYKTEGGVEMFPSDNCQSDLKTAISMLGIQPYEFADKGKRMGPAVPENQNWLPQSLLSTKKGITGNANGYYSKANALVKSVNDVMDSFRLKNYAQLIYWVN